MQGKTSEKTHILTIFREIDPGFVHNKADHRRYSMNIVLTGSRGTLAQALIPLAKKRGWNITAWDRNAVNPEDNDAGNAWLESQNPDAICHLAMGSEYWAGRLAGFAASRRIPFLFTSSVMVFDNRKSGPYLPTHKPETDDEYGQYKIRCEDQIMANNDNAAILRLGWQFDHRRGGNNMYAQLQTMMTEGNHIDASRLWIPACSHMEHSSEIILNLIKEGSRGIWHADANARSGLSYPHLLETLNSRYGMGLRFQENEDYSHDQRMDDPRLELPPPATWPLGS